MWQLPASFGTPLRSFGWDKLDLDRSIFIPISALASTTGHPKERHRRDTFRSLTGAYFLDSLIPRPPCFFCY